MSATIDLLGAVPRPLRWLAAAGVMALLFWFSSQHSVAVTTAPYWDTITRKGAHLGIYGLLAACYAWALPPMRYRFVTALLLTVLYGVSDEIHQTLVPPREGSPIDVLIDASGAALALGFLKLVCRRVQAWRDGPAARESAIARVE